jgi:hypothetical protein
MILRVFSAFRLVFLGHRLPPERWATSAAEAARSPVTSG